MATAGTVNSMVRSLMADDDTAVFPDATLLVPSNQAYHLVQQKLVDKGCTVLRNTSATLALPAVTGTVISAGSSPALPSDFMVPYKLWERPTGGVAADWTLMEATNDLPDRDQFNYLEQWKFENGQIVLVGATIPTDVRILYEAILPDFVDATSTIGILQAEDAIAFYTAAYMAMSRGQLNMAAYFEKKADEAVEALAMRFTHSNQSVHGRRRLAYSRRAIGKH